jgi:acyl carrier protein
LSLNSLELVRAAIDDVNNQNDDEVKIGTAEDTALFGGDSGIDSLMLVNLFVAIEEKIEDATGKVVVIVNEEALSDGSHPFRTIGTLAAYINKITG